MIDIDMQYIRRIGLTIFFVLICGGILAVVRHQSKNNKGPSGIALPPKERATNHETRPRMAVEDRLVANVNKWLELQNQSREQRTTDGAKEILRTVFLLDAESAFDLIEAESDYGIRRSLIISLFATANPEQCETILRKARELVSGGDLGAVYEKGFRALTKQAPEQSIAVWRGLPGSAAKSNTVSAIVEAWPASKDRRWLWEFYGDMELPEE